MDFLKNLANDNNNADNGNNNSNNGNNFDNNNNPNQANTGNQQQNSSGGVGGFLDGITNKIQGAAGGGRESENNEDYLDKGVDFVQEKFLGQGAQDNETAIEQAKDEQISDYIRGKYRTATGSDMPIKDKPTTLDQSTD